MFALHFSGSYSSIWITKGMILKICILIITNLHLLLWLNSAKNLWIKSFKPNLNNTQKHDPKSNPSSTWFKLWAPRYILDIGTKIVSKIEIHIFLIFLPDPLYSIRTPNPASTENQLWPLGFPYSMGQYIPIFLIESLVQKGLGSQWYALSRAAQKVLNIIKANIINPLPFLWLITTMAITPMNTKSGSIVIVIIMKNQSNTIFEFLCATLII